MRGATKIILGLSTLTGAGYLINNQRFRAFILKTKDDVQQVNTDKKTVQANVNNLKSALNDNLKVVQDIQTEINEFKFMINPRIQKIQKRLNRLKKN